MIPVIEDSISNVLNDSFLCIKETPGKIDTILSMEQTKRKELKTYLSNNTVKIKRGYPRTSAELPCICILLSGEDESEEGIGDYMEDLIISTEVNREELVVQQSTGKDLYRTFIKLSQFPIKQVNVLHNISTGEMYPIDMLDLSELNRGVIWLPASCEEGDVIQVEYLYITSATDGVYTQFDSNFRIEVWTTNADLTVQLYYLTKWALLVGRDRLHQEVGLYRQKLGGSDFQPAPSFFPDFVYRRALTFWCQLTESVPSQEIPYISKIEVNRTIDFDTQIGGGESNG